MIGTVTYIPFFRNSKTFWIFWLFYYIFYFVGYNSNISRIQDIGFVALLILQLLCQKHFFLYLLSCRPDRPSSETFFWVENGRNDAIPTSLAPNLSQPLEKCLVTMCKGYSREGIESLVTIGTGILEIYRKNKGGKNASPPPGRLRS